MTKIRLPYEIKSTCQASVKNIANAIKEQLIARYKSNIETEIKTSGLKTCIDLYFEGFDKDMREEGKLKAENYFNKIVEIYKNKVPEFNDTERRLNESIRRYDSEDY